MTAETFTGTRAATTRPTFMPRTGNGTLCVAYGTYEIASAVEAGDIYEICRVPAGCTVVGGWLYGDDLDTGTETLDIDVGWKANADEAADPDGFGNFGVLSGDTITELKPVAGLLNPLQGVLLADGPKTFTAETTIQITITAAANATGTGTVSLVVYYTPI